MTIAAGRAGVCRVDDLPVVLGVQLHGDRLIGLERLAGAQQARLVARSLVAPDGDVVVVADPGAAATDGAAAVD